MINKKHDLILFISLAILFVLGIAGVIIAFDDEYDSRRFGIAISLCIFIVVIFILVQIIIQEQTPTAMDVYQGKTTLEITCKDGVPVDSTVVWK